MACKQPTKFTEVALLRWAVAYVKENNDALAQSHTNVRTKEIDCPDVRAEVRDAKRWIRKARAVIAADKRQRARAK